MGNGEWAHGTRDRNFGCVSQPASQGQRPWNSALKGRFIKAQGNALGVHF